MSNILLVGLGGAVGSVLRYLVSLAVAHRFDHRWPAGTFTVNITGSFLIGLLAGLLLRFEAPHSWRLLLVTGFLGGYTTFSALESETLTLLQAGDWPRALAYPLLSVVVGFGAVAGGAFLSRAF
ncbi:MAG TPA: fluoride efflux transporter CrcB [Bryobacteraceae bacterium]|nr:fluoride efflux transporter CrcB [Bryobacteraceae bacterium]